jgi:hypothetical protein
MRTTAEAPFFGLWRDPEVMRALAWPDALTTARYEPILRGAFGAGQVDLVFESAQRCAVVAGIRLDAVQLLVRERSPLIWPSAVAAVLGEEACDALETAILPWLRSVARAQSMSREIVEHFSQSDRFARARAGDLVGAAPLARTLPLMAPFVYARRFARGAAIRLECRHASLGQAVLCDLAASIEREPGPASAAFEDDWYGVRRAGAGAGGAADVLIVERGDPGGAPIVIELAPDLGGTAPRVEIPSPVPWDVLFSFDAADAPSVGAFAVSAPQPSLREPRSPVSAPVSGVSAGTIAVAVGAEALAMRSSDVGEAEVFRDRLGAEGFEAALVTEVDDPALRGAQLIHIIGGRYERHTLLFARFARENGIPFVFDVPPEPSPLRPLEMTFVLMHRRALDDAQLAEYIDGYESERVEPGESEGPSRAEEDGLRAAFREQAAAAQAIFCIAEDRAALVAALPAAADRIFTRGAFAQAEAAPTAIGHLVPSAPFALVHGEIAVPLNALYVAVAAQRRNVPLVIAGPVYDVDCLQILRGSAPAAIILADPDEATIAALYRSARLWVSAAPRPRSAAPLVRAVDCGALPVVVGGSPFARIAGVDAPTFSARAIDDCAEVLARAIDASDRLERVAALRARLNGRRDPATAFGAVMAGYLHAATPV